MMKVTNFSVLFPFGMYTQSSIKVLTVKLKMIKATRSKQPESLVRRRRTPYEKVERSQRTRTRKKDDPTSLIPSPPSPSEETNEISRERPSEDIKEWYRLIRNVFLEVVTKLWRQEPESIAFRYPVDPLKLDIPDYPQVIKKPMDLLTILTKLNSSTTEFIDPWEVIDDIWLMFENAWLYNNKGSTVYLHCSKLSKIAEAELTPIMLRLGYCCAKYFSFDPQPLHCFGKNEGEKCSINVGSPYFYYDEKYAVCQDCFNKKENNKLVTVHVADHDDDYSDTDDDKNLDDSGVALSPPRSIKPHVIYVRKERFIPKVNDEQEPEPKVQCSRCRRWLHQICVLHLETEEKEPFTCVACLGTPLQLRFKAAHLPVTGLSHFVEDYVRQKLAEKGPAAAQIKVTIRITSSIEKVVEVKSNMYTRFVQQGELSPRFPYKAKSLCAFQEIDGVDVLFFVMYAQEYGADCPRPNMGRVYISYLDSVNFFQPKKFRTAVYHDIILGYLDYVKGKGFHTAHIWACPPNKGEDYILYAHPPNQKVPCVARLIGWYQKLFEKGINDKILVAKENLWDHVKKEGYKLPAEVPYFEGDFWPYWMEDVIVELEKEESERRSRNGTAIEKKKKKCKKTKEKESPPDLEGRTREVMEQNKERFFVAHLHSNKFNEPIQDPDPDIPSFLMRADDEGRDALLAFAKENNYEFSSLRRAKFSTQVVMYHRNEEVGGRILAQRGPPLTSTSASTPPSGRRAREAQLEMNLFATGVQELSTQNYVRELTHAQLCKDDSCKQLNSTCFKIKGTLAHLKSCSDRKNCRACLELICFIYKHSLVCREGEKCLVPYCLNMKRCQLSRQQQSLPPSPPPDYEGRVEASPVEAEATPAKVKRLYNILKDPSTTDEKHKNAIQLLREHPKLVPSFRKLCSLEDARKNGDDNQDEAMEMDVDEGQRKELVHNVIFML